MVICPNCEEHFNVIWNRSYEGQAPEYCPMCGAEIDYSKVENDGTDD